MTRYDGMAFPAADISETQHGAMPCTDRATPETTSGNVVNDPVGTVDVQNLPTPDTSFAAFLIEPEAEV